MNNETAILTEEEMIAHIDAIPSPPKPYQEQIDEVDSRTLDVAEAVTSLYETMLVGVTA